MLVRKLGKGNIHPLLVAPQEAGNRSTSRANYIALGHTSKGP